MIQSSNKNTYLCWKRISTLCMVILLTVLLLYLPTTASAGTPVKIQVGKKTYKATFYNNKTAKALLKRLPVSYKMNELNGNEKYKYLNYNLPTNEKAVKKIKAGDIMLYGSDCLVIFYKSFRTNYEYTRVGRINNPKKLKKAVGKGKVRIKIRKK